MIHIRIIALKNHQESASELKKKKCTFKCLVCSERHWLVKDLNAHFRSGHEAPMCDICSKHLTSPMSLKKHVYMHQEQKIACEVWEQFSFSIATRQPYGHTCEYDKVALFPTGL